LIGSVRAEGQTAKSGVRFGWDVIRKSGNRFSEKIMLKERDEIMMRFHLIAS
jgi:hypothetical protein